MKDKKDGKARTSYSGGYNTNLNNSPLATSTTEKDDLTLRSYHHGYYLPLPPPSMSIPFPTHSSSTSSYSKSFQTPIDYHTTNMYEMATNYNTPIPPTLYDNYYTNSQISSVQHPYV
jgi:hypothetical protein